MNNDNEIEIETDENGLVTNIEQARLIIHDIACRSYDALMQPGMTLLLGPDYLTSILIALAQAHDFSCPHKNEHGDEEHPEPEATPDAPAKPTYHPFDPSLN